MSSPENLSQLRCLSRPAGDGTVGRFDQPLSECPAAIFPLGTENLFAKFLKLPRSGRLLADLIADGKTRRYDLAQIGTRRFCFDAGIGFGCPHRPRNACPPARTHSALAILGPIWNAWWNATKTPNLRVYCDHETTPLIAGRVRDESTGLCTPIQMAATANGHDGRLDVRVYELSSRFGCCTPSGKRVGWLGTIAERRFTHRSHRAGRGR